MILTNQTLIIDSDKFMSFKFGDDCTILFYFTYCDKFKCPFLINLNVFISFISTFIYGWCGLCKL